MSKSILSYLYKEADLPRLETLEPIKDLKETFQQKDLIPKTEILNASQQPDLGLKSETIQPSKTKIQPPSTPETSSKIPTLPEARPIPESKLTSQIEPAPTPPSEFTPKIPESPAQAGRGALSDIHWGPMGIGGLLGGLLGVMFAPKENRWLYGLAGLLLGALGGQFGWPVIQQLFGKQSS